MAKKLPLLMFVHGFGCDHTDWRSQVDELSGTAPCFTPDMPGHGLAAVPGNSTVEELADAVNAWRNRLAQGQGVVLIGHSLGCKIIREAVARKPEDVLGLVLVDGRIYLGGVEPALEHHDREMAAHGFLELCLRNFRQMFTSNAPADVVSGALSRLRRMDQDFGAALLRDAIAWDGRRGLKTLETLKDLPVLAIQSSIVTPRGRMSLREGEDTDFSRSLREYLPLARVITVADAGHFPMIEKPAAVVAEIKRFLAGLL